MKNLVFCFGLLLLVLMISADCITSAESKEKPMLDISAHPRQGFTPMIVNFHAVLKGVAPDDSEFYCLAEEWDFGDDSKSKEVANCEPYTPGSTIKSEFFAEHEYDEGGSFGVRLILGDKKIQSRKISIAVTEKKFP